MEMHRLITFMLPYGRSMALVVLAILGVTATGLLAPWLVREVVLIADTGTPDAASRLTIVATTLVLIYLSRSSAEAAVFHCSHMVAFNTCRDLRDVALADLRRLRAMILQDVFLFNCTIDANIRFGNQNADQDAVAATARQAGAHDFMSALPKGYQTVVGERGTPRLSGGQKQRISIARALLKDAPILILDEATSAIDTEAKAAIQDNLDRLITGRTAIVIAHRLSTIRKGDRIAVLERGRITQLGAHDDIANESGAHARLLTPQGTAAV